MSSAVDWDAVVITCQTRDTATAVQQELKQRQTLGFLPQDSLVLAIEDPQDHVGSGGATINALLVVAEHISARRDYSVVVPDVLYNSRILIFHMGLQYAYEPCGRAFLSLPIQIPHKTFCEFIPSNLDSLFYLLSHKIAVGAPPGVWECGTDQLLDLPEDLSPLNVEGLDACILTVPSSVEYGSRHGVCKASPEGYIEDIIFRGSYEKLEECKVDEENIPLVAGVVYFSPSVAEILLGFHTTPPLDACTYMGIDSGAKPIRLTLFFDLMLAMCHDVTEDDFVSGLRSDTYGWQRSETSTKSMAIARQMIWERLRGFQVKMFYIPEGEHAYLEDVDKPFPELIQEFGLKSNRAISRSTRIHCIVQADLADSVTVQNSIIDSGVSVGASAVVFHSHLHDNFIAGANCFVSGVESPQNTATPFQIQPSTVLFGVNIRHPKCNSGISNNKIHHVKITWGLNDKLQKPITDPGLTFCNKPWADFFKRTGVIPEDLWPTDSDGKQNKRQYLLNAKLFPMQPSEESIMWLQGLPGYESNDEIRLKWRSSVRWSLDDILNQVDHTTELACRRVMFHEISQVKIRRVLLEQRGEALIGLYRTAVADHCADDILRLLDEVACECKSPGIAARTLANIADVLGAMAMGQGGQRSGPAGNKQWAVAFDLLEKEDICGGVRALAEEREQWLSQPVLLVRAARHYEGAAQILIRQAILTVTKFITTTPSELTRMNQWILAESPARIDMAGSWSDTPPITYEHGGAVLNAAITIDGQRPIGARVRRIPECHLVLNICTKKDTLSTQILTQLDQMSDYNNPHAPGALLKTAFICAGVIDFPSNTDLREQLSEKYEGGFELSSWSDLPHGSGLGTSSILAGAIIAALWKASGHNYDLDSLTHAVANLEQMLTTAGGWQDQVGGLVGGVKVGHSAAVLPMHIKITYPPISTETIQAFSERLVLVYTGKTRLARNLLQTVLRNWYARSPEIVEVEDSLVKLAWQCSKAFVDGDLEAIGRCLDECWILKKKMAVGCEPRGVTLMMDALRPHVYGLSMAGAGGGGFLYVLTKQPNAMETVKDILKAIPNIGNVSFHKSSVDMEGLKVTVEEEEGLKVTGEGQGAF